jgi:hypothetical protein
MKTETNQQLILSSLLESSKTTRQLALELKYVNKKKKGIPGYSTIKDDLDKLKNEKYIEGNKVKSGKPGAPATLYSIIFSIPNLIHILERYPDLISKMQKNDSICENIFREHLDLIYGSNDMEFLNSRFGGCANRNWSITSTRTSPIVSHPTDNSSKKDGVGRTEITFFEKIERLFKEKLSYPVNFSDFF